MPRGSRPGERRGGRQRGTPNKKTMLKNAVFCAAAAHTNASPLHFMLGLMRDPDVPTDLRIEMAIAAAPYVHGRPQAARRVRTNPLDSSPIKSSPDISAAKMEEELTAPEQSAEGAADLSPLNFLLCVMRSPGATPEQRIKAAKIAARYKHAPVPHDKMASADEYGFTISRTLAKEICNDWARLDDLENHRVGPVSANTVSEVTEIRARQDARYQFLQCPPGYSPERDVKRWAELKERRLRGRLTMAEETEFAYVIARITACDAGIYRTPAGRARRRIEELETKSWMRKRSKASNKPKPLEEILLDAKKCDLPPIEESELQQLLKDFPRSSWPKVAFDDHYLVEAEAKKNSLIGWAQSLDELTRRQLDEAAKRLAADVAKLREARERARS